MIVQIGIHGFNYDMIFPFLKSVIADFRKVKPLAKSSMLILQILGNLTSENEEITQKVIECNAIDFIEESCITSHNPQLRKLSLWVISNILSGNLNQVSAVFSRKIKTSLVKYMFMENDLLMIYEIFYCFSNAFNTTVYEQVVNLINEENFISHFLMALDRSIQDNLVLLKGLDVLHKLLNIGDTADEDDNQIAIALLKQSISKIIDKIMYTTKDGEVQSKIKEILDEYFETE